MNADAARVECTDATPCEVCSDVLLGRYSPGDDCLGLFVPNDADRAAWATIAEQS